MEIGFSSKPFFVVVKLSSFIIVSAVRKYLLLIKSVAVLASSFMISLIETNFLCVSGSVILSFVWAFSVIQFGSLCRHSVAKISVVMMIFFGIAFPGRRIFQLRDIAPIFSLPSVIFGIRIIFCRIVAVLKATGASIAVVIIASPSIITTPVIKSIGAFVLSFIKANPSSVVKTFPTFLVAIIVTFATVVKPTTSVAFTTIMIVTTVIIVIIIIYDASGSTITLRSPTVVICPLTVIRIVVCLWVVICL